MPSSFGHHAARNRQTQFPRLRHDGTDRTGRPAPGATGRIAFVAIEDLARDWLEAERTASVRGAADDQQAIDTSAAYDAAIRSASREDLLLAWQAALRRQGEVEMGSKAWEDARSVSQLLKAEYEASPR